MFNSITWKEFIEFIVWILIVYYTIVSWLFKQEIIQWVNKRKIVASASGVFFQNNQSGASETVPRIDKEINLFESCIEELNEFFEKAKSKKWIKEELLFALKKVLGKYHGLQNSSNEETIQQVIIVQCKSISSVHIEAEDLNQLW